MKNRGSRAAKSGQKPRWYEAKEKEDTKKAREELVKSGPGTEELDKLISALAAQPVPLPSTWESIQISLPSYDFQTTVEDARKAFEQMGRVMTATGDSFTKYTWKKKRITDIRIDYEVEEIDVTSFSDPARRWIPREIIRCTDQDGYSLPEELEAEVQRAWRNWNLTEEVLKRLIDEHNSGPVPEIKAPLPGHFQGCQYLGSDHFACTCQPPTLTGRVLAWKCICCDHPVADEQYGLCKMCEAHQDSYDAQVEADHEAALV